VFCSNNNNNNSGNNFIHSHLQDENDFSPTFNVPDMDISAGALNEINSASERKIFNAVLVATAG